MPSRRPETADRIMLPARRARVLVAFGTRPEAIKLAPVIQELSRHPDVVEPRICVTAQHRELLDQVLDLFGIVPDTDLDLMRRNQTLPDLTARTLTGMADVLEREKPDWVLVQGDTTTVLATTLAACYARVPVGHVEAGLRTHCRYNPFPEEMNRRVTGVLATLHFAPTATAQQALLSEGVEPATVFLTGNTIVDALHGILTRPVSAEALQLLSNLQGSPAPPANDRLDKILLITAHRRESFGRPLESVCRGLRAVVERNPDVLLVFPVHPNPKVREPVERLLSGHSRIRLIEPLPYEPFLRLMNTARFVLTDSGGIQEEASVLGKPVLVLRDETERPEIVAAGVGKLVGTDEERVLEEAERLLDDEDAYRAMAKTKRLFGDGHAAERIAKILIERFPGQPGGMEPCDASPADG